MCHRQARGCSRAHAETGIVIFYSPLGLPYTRSRAPRRRRAPIAWLARGTRSLGTCERPLVFSEGLPPRTPLHALSRAAASARSDREARSWYSLARYLREASRHDEGR